MHVPDLITSIIIVMVIVIIMVILLLRYGLKTTAARAAVATCAGQVNG